MHVKSWVAGTCFAAIAALTACGEPDGATDFDAPLPLSVLATSFTYGDVLSGVETGMLAHVSEAVAAGTCGAAAGNCPLEALVKTAALIEVCDSVSVRAWDESTQVADLDDWNRGRRRDAAVQETCQQQSAALAALAPLAGTFDLSGIPEDLDSTSPFHIDRRAASYMEHAGRQSRDLVSLTTYLSAYRYLRNTWLGAEAEYAWEHAVRQDQMVEDMLLARVQDDPVAALTALQQFALEKLPKDRGLLEDPRTAEAQLNFASARYFFAAQQFRTTPADGFPDSVNELDVNSQELARQEGSRLARALVDAQTVRN